MTRSYPTRQWMLLVLIGAMLASACDDKRRHQASNAVPFEEAKAREVNDADCDQVVKTFIQALADAQHARAGGFGTEVNREKYDQAMATVLKLMASDKVYETVKKSSNSVPKDVDKQAANTLIAESWVSIAAHYADAILWPTLSINFFRNGDRGRAEIQLENPNERKKLEAIEASAAITSAKGENGRPLVKNSELYWDAVRAEALKQGFNVPVGAMLTLTLLNTNGAWRVEDMKLGPAPLRIVATPATTQPVSTLGS